MTDAKSDQVAQNVLKLVPTVKPVGDAPAAAKDSNAHPTVSKPKSTKWSVRQMLLAAAAFLVVAGTATYFASPYVLGISVTPYVVTRENIVQTIVASGQLETASRVEVSSQVMGKVLHVLVQQGDAVKPGDTMVVLDGLDARAVLDQSSATLAQARAKLALIATYNLPAARQTLAQSQATFRGAKLQLDRVNILARQGYTTRASREDAQRAFDIADSQRTAAQLSVTSLSPGGSDVDIAIAAVKQAEAAVRSSESRLELLNVKAPIDAAVVLRKVEPGNVIQVAQVLFMLAPPIGRRLVVQIDERSFSLIKIGQTAVASADAFPKERFTAHVSDINPAVDPQRGSVEVKLGIEHAPTYLKEDMTVSVDIEVAKRTGALVLPSAAIRDAMGVAPHVFVIAAGRAEDRKVTLGTRGQTKTEILSGLAEKDLVIPVTATTVKSGAKVRATVSATP